MSLLYLDSSAIAKLFIKEEHTGLVEAAVDTADGLVCSVIGYVEVMGIFSRAHNQKRLSVEVRDDLVERFGLWWNGVNQLPVNARSIVAGGANAIKYGIRGIDGLHLAAAEEAQKSGPVVFACFDERLAQIAYEGGFQMVAHPDWLARWESA